MQRISEFEGKWRSAHVLGVAGMQLRGRRRACSHIQQVGEEGSVVCANALLEDQQLHAGLEH